MKNKLKITTCVSCMFLVFACGKSSRNGLHDQKPTASEFIETSVSKLESRIISRLNNTQPKEGEYEKAIVFWVVMDRFTKQIKLSNFRVQDYFPLPGGLFEGSTFARAAYTPNFSGALKPEYSIEVSCSGGKNGNWSKTCSGNFSCGSSVVKCLGEGGCATVCKKNDMLVFNGDEFLGLKTDLLATNSDILQAESNKNSAFQIGKSSTGLKKMVDEDRISIVEVAYMRSLGSY